MHIIKKEIASQESLNEALGYADLTEDESNSDSKHAVRILLDELIKSLEKLPNSPQPKIIRLSPITTITNNFDRLKFPIDNPGRSSTYIRYVDANTVLRGHVTAMVPPSLDELSA
jgi:phenylalanyl-tRNA synthetase alpha chain